MPGGLRDKVSGGWCLHVDASHPQAATSTHTAAPTARIPTPQVLPPLLLELRDASLQPTLLPIVLKIVQTQEPGEFADATLPALKCARRQPFNFLCPPPDPLLSRCRRHGPTVPAHAAVDPPTRIPPTPAGPCWRVHLETRCCCWCRTPICWPSACRRRRRQRCCRSCWCAPRSTATCARRRRCSSAPRPWR